MNRSDSSHIGGCVIVPVKEMRREEGYSHLGRLLSFALPPSSLFV